MTNKFILTKLPVLLVLLSVNLCLAQVQTAPVRTQGPTPIGISMAAKNAYDTVYVSNQTTTYMIFPENVATMDLGSKSYVGKIESGNMLYLKPLHANAAPSSLLVRTTGEQIYLHYIAYQKQPGRIFWDYRPDSLRNTSLLQNKAPIAEKAKQYTRQLEQLQKQPKRKIARQAASGIEATVNYIAVDHEAIYLLFDLKNRTAIPYEFEYVSFTYKERRSRKSQRRIDPEEKVVEPLAKIAVPAVPPQGRAFLSYVLPLHAGTRKGLLEVVLREANGDRVLSVRIPARKIASAFSLSASGPTVQSSDF
jgi:hypothetical protein